MTDLRVLAQGYAREVLAVGGEATRLLESKNPTARPTSGDLQRTIDQLLVVIVKRIFEDIAQIQGEESGVPIRPETRTRVVAAIEDTLQVRRGTLTRLHEGSIKSALAFDRAVAELRARVQAQSSKP